MNVGLIAAILGLLSLVASDQFGAWNRRKYRSDKARGQASVEAFKHNRHRKALFDRFAFCVLVLAAGLSTYSAFADKRNDDTEISTIKSRLSGLESQSKAMTNQFEASSDRARQIQSQQQEIRDRLNEIAGQSANAGSRLTSLENGSRSLSSRVSMVERRTRSHASRRGARNDAQSRKQ
ncbi:MAG TPA: hypothetical protein VGN24_07610 [Rhodanobacter sp.]|nr:hypothetical protein [Rhodanobacter sp.]